jgi:hypothetical protein
MFNGFDWENKKWLRAGIQDHKGVKVPMLPKQDAQENVFSGTLKGDYHENSDGALYPLSLLWTPSDIGQSW